MGEQEVVVAFQGEPGAYSEQAAFELLGKSNIKTEGYDSFENCFRALKEGKVDFTLLPIENSLGGSIHANYDFQLRHDFFIVAEHDFRVRHCLMVLPGVKMEDIKTVKSHPQALAQCDGYLRSIGVQGESTYDTAGSAKMIASGNLRDCGAIASALAAEHYGLEILDQGIEDDTNNYTRFLLISKRWLPLQDTSQHVWKTSMVFSLINYPGVLVKALSAFSFREISLTKLESRPDKLRLKGRQVIPAVSYEELQIPMEDRKLIERLKFPELEEGAMNEQISESGERFQFIFYVDFLGNLRDTNVQNALRHLSELASFLRILGCYPKGGVLCDFVAEAVGVEPWTSPSLRNKALRASGGSRKALYPSSTPGLKIGIQGFGNFGQFLAKTFVKLGHEVYACSRSDYTAIADELGVNYSTTTEEMIAQSGGLDCLVLSVSILSFESVVRHLPMDLLKDVLIIDVLSVKTLPKNVLQVLLPPETDILCTHPMFGPESGKFSWRGLPFVYEKVRLKSNEADLRCERFLDIFRKAGCRMVDMSCEIHDQAAAGSQFVTHFTGRMLAELNLRSTPINTKGFETLLALVENTCKDSFDLFSALYRCNPNASAQLEALENAMVKLRTQLSSATNLEEPHPIFSKFVERIQPSKTSETHAKALELKRQGKDIITTLTVGEPDFAPPKPILDAVCEATEKGMTRYTPVGGMFELKQAIADDYAKRKGVVYNPNTDILVTHGGKQAIFCAILSLCHPGDEVVIPAPYWVSYADIVLMSEAKPVVVSRDPTNGYVLTPEQLENSMSPKTRMLILCNPCNPTGCTYTREELEALANVLRKPEYQHVYILADEIYERLTYDGLEHVSFASLEGMSNRTLIVNGFAKAYAMTGFRLGYLAVHDKAIISTALKLQSQVNSCASSISQYAGIAALNKVTDDMLNPLYQELQQKRDLMVKKLQDIPNIVCPTPKGAFYVFPDISYYLNKNATTPGGKTVNNTTEFCTYLIEEFGLALPPGDAFGGPFGVRFSYAASFDDIEKAVTRFRAALENLKLQSSL